MGYYQRAGFEGWIYIGDSSDGDDLTKTKEVVQQHKANLNLIHDEYPGLSNSHCIARMLNSVPTKYAALLPDDDFLVPNGLRDCIDFLEGHSDYTAAHGVAFVYSLTGGDVYGRMGPSGAYKLRSIEDNTGSERIKAHLADYSVTLFCVHSTETWREMYRKVPSVSDPAFADELLPTSTAVIRGKVKALDCLYLARQTHPGRYQHLDLYDWILNPRWHESYKVFRDWTVDQLAFSDQIDVDTARAVMKEATWNYLANQLRVRYFSSQGSGSNRQHSTIRNTLRKSPTPRAAWQITRSFLPGLDRRLSRQALMRRTSRYHADFMPIYEAVTGVE